MLIHMLTLTTSSSTIISSFDDTGFPRLWLVRDIDVDYFLNIRKSNICIGAPCTFTVPGTVVNVVKSIADTSECVPVSFDINVDYAVINMPAWKCCKDMQLAYAHLSNRGKPDEANRRDARPRDVKPEAASTASTA